MPNRLAAETSPYLLQHAGNPVDWYAWGPEAFDEARRSNRPVLLSVGYSSCHWCHVMAHESFENDEIAALMNRHFVNVKVDREERPDIDSVYMSAVQAMTGQGGWPMTVFMTPDGEPFYAGTYFPPEDGYGRPGFARVLEALHQAWNSDRDKLMETAMKVVDHLRHGASAGAVAGPNAGEEHTATAVERLNESFDAEWGGFGNAPKFPPCGALEFLLTRRARLPGTEEADRMLQMTTRTLEAMWSGGMYDHLGGGFSRYSVDARWVVPHFEKMLYDNAQLARVYLHAYQATGQSLYRQVARETLDYLVREMLDGSGGFYSAQDADSEGIEGSFFVWTPAQMEAALGPELAPAALAEFGVTAEGNFSDPHHPELTGRTVLTRRSRTPLGVEQFGAIRTRLFEARTKRVRPGLDDKVLVSWNGLALAAFAEAGRVLNDSGYVDIARANAAFVRENLWHEGRLLHTYKAGVARINGMLDDYAFYGLGLVELYRATGDLEYLAWAKELFEVLLGRFSDVDGGGFFDTPDDGEQLLVRQKSLFDASIPSGNGAAALLAHQLGRYFDVREWEQLALKILGGAERVLGEAPTGFGSMLQVLEQSLSARRELVVVGPAAERAAFIQELADAFDPSLLLAPTADGEGLPLFEGRKTAGPARAYLCHNMVCELPAETPEQLAAQLRGRG